MNDADETLYPIEIELAPYDGRQSLGTYCDRKGNPIPFSRWARLVEVGDPEYGPDPWDYKVVGRTRVGAYVISTVWLGIDHGFGFTELPILFETLVFAADAWDGHAPLTEFDGRRYSTEEEAAVGHADMVTLVRATALQPDGTDPTPVDE